VRTHGSTSAVLNPHAQLEDIFWGIYNWLDEYPTEAILVSVQVDNDDNTAELQQKVCSLIWRQCERLLSPKHSCMPLQEIYRPTMDQWCVSYRL